LASQAPSMRGGVEPSSRAAVDFIASAANRVLAAGGRRAARRSSIASGATRSSGREGAGWGADAPAGGSSGRRAPERAASPERARSLDRFAPLAMTALAEAAPSATTEAARRSVRAAVSVV
jgi:hypothetical protein